jgi:hypothetical protein
MQLSEIILARTIWFIDLKFINPVGLAWGPIQSAMKERYKFLVYPVVPSDFDLQKGTKYEGGEFEFNGDKIAVSLTVYLNGWSVDTQVSTEASDAFLADLSAWLSKSFKIREGNWVSRILYDSQVGFISEVRLSESLNKLKAIKELIINSSGNEQEDFTALVFGSDPASKNPTIPTFSFERRVNVNFSENKYYSKAALPTSEHIRLVEQVEAILLG